MSKQNATHVVYKTNFGSVVYLVKFNRQYPGDSEFHQNQTHATRYTPEKAASLARKLNSGLDAGIPKRYGFCYLGSVK